MNFNGGLYLIIGKEFLQGKDLKKAAEEAILGGVDIIQLREKNSGTREFYSAALQLKEITSKYKVPLIINDRIDIAIAVDAEGVHMGQKDMPIDVARRILGYNKIIGATVRSVKQAKIAKEQGADYIGVGAVYPTTSKGDVSKIIGIKGLKDIIESVPIPTVAIGGINKHNIEEVLGAKPSAIALISAILKSENIRVSAEDLKMKIKVNK